MSSQQNLILTVSGRHASQFGSSAQKTFIQQGGSIGRAEDCDWVLPASGVSRVHAMVRYLNGMYFIEDRSTNGMLLNGANLTRGEPAMLGDTDRLQVDSFEIEVRLQTIGAPGPLPPASDEYNPDLTQVAFSPATRAPVATGPVEDLFDHLWQGIGTSQEPPAMAASPAAPGPSSGAGRDHVDLMAVLGAPLELDPLQLLQASAPVSRPVAVQSDASAWHHSASSQDHFRPPSVLGAGAQLPEDWDLSGDDHPPALAQPLAASPAIGAPSMGRDMEQDRILRIVTEGVMEVLRARAEVKNSFRLPVTVIQRTENNPLKFAATAQDALHKIGGGEGGAFLTGAAAFEDAFDDIRCHQMAMLAGMRAGYDAVLRSFDPDRLEQDVDRDGRRFGLGGKGRYWERYRAQYQALSQDPDDCFRRLFGEDFARAYETQLERYKSSRRSETK